MSESPRMWCVSEAYRMRKFSSCPIAPEDNRAVRIKFAHLDKDGVFNNRISTVDISASVRDRGDADYNLDILSSYLAGMDNIEFEPFNRFWLEDRFLLERRIALEERFRLRKHQGNKKRRTAEDDNDDASAAAPAVDMEY